MITVSIYPIKEYCNISEKSEKRTYSISQLKALGKNNINSVNEMRHYLDKVKDICIYLLKILDVLSLLSREYHEPGNKDYLGEKILFDEVFLYIQRNLSHFQSPNILGNNTLKTAINFNNSFLLSYKEYIFSTKFEDNSSKFVNFQNYLTSMCPLLEEVVRNIKKEINKISREKENKESTLQYLKKKLIDIYRYTIYEWTEIFYCELKKYCNIDDNKNYYFALDKVYTDFFGFYISDAGDIVQKEKIDNCIKDFNNLIIEIDNTVIEKKQNTRPPKHILVSDYREVLFNLYDELKPKFEALKNLSNDEGEKYIKDNEEKNGFLWSENERLLVVLIMKLLKKEDKSAALWKHFENSFGKSKMWQTAKRYLDDKKKKKDFKDGVSEKADKIIIEINDYLKNNSSKKENLLKFPKS